MSKLRQLACLKFMNKKLEDPEEDWIEANVMESNDVSINNPITCNKTS